MSRTRCMFLAAFVTLAIAACGGGGGGTAVEPYDGPLTIPHDGTTGIPSGGGDTSSGGGGGGGPGTVSFRVLDSGAMTLITTPQVWVVRNTADYASLWLAHNGTNPSFAGPPVVDFSVETLIGIFLGGRPTGGYSVRVADIVPEGIDGVRVTAEETQPGPSCIVTQAVSYPFVIVAVPRYEGPTAIDHTTVVHACP